MRGDEVEPAVSSSRGAQLVGRKLQLTGDVPFRIKSARAEAESVAFCAGPRCLILTLTFWSE